MKYIEQIFLHQASKTIIVTMKPAASEVIRHDRHGLPAKVYRYDNRVLPVVPPDNDGYHYARVEDRGGDMDVFLRSTNSTSQQQLVESCQPIGNLWELMGIAPIDPKDCNTYERFCDFAAKIVFDYLEFGATNRRQANNENTRKHCSYWQFVNVSKAGDRYESEIFYTMLEMLAVAVKHQCIAGSDYQLIKFLHAPTPQPQPFCNVAAKLAKPVKPSAALAEALQASTVPPNENSEKVNRNLNLKM
jgi:hypothetical protein